MKTGTNEEKIRKLGTFKRLINLGLTAVCLGMEIGLFAYHWLVHFQHSVVEPLRDAFWFKGHLLEVAIYAVILLMLSLMYGGMRLGYLKNAELIFSQVFATLIANLVIYAELSVMAFQLFHPKVFIMMMVEQTAVIIVYINIANKVYRSLFPPRKLLLIHGDRPIEGICAKFESRRDKYVITRTVNVKEGYDELCRIILQTYESDECNAVVMGIPSEFI